MSELNLFFALVFFCLCSLAGGFVSHELKPHINLSGRHDGAVYFTDAAGRPRLDFDGTPLETLLGPDHLPRLQLGLEEAAGEGAPRGTAPFINLSNNRGELRMSYHLDGPNESPVIVMKDRHGRDRVVLGLDAKDPAQEPFLALYDTQGRANMVFGTSP